MENAVVVGSVAAFQELEAVRLAQVLVELHKPQHEVIGTGGPLARLHDALQGLFELLLERADAAAGIAGDGDEGVLGGPKVFQPLGGVAEVAGGQGGLR